MNTHIIVAISGAHALVFHVVYLDRFLNMDLMRRKIVLVDSKGRLSLKSNVVPNNSVLFINRSQMKIFYKLENYTKTITA